MKLKNCAWALLAAAAMMFLPTTARAEDVYLNVDDGEDITIQLF